MTADHQTALVIGAGIAGSQCARALAERGIDVTVLDSRPAQGAGGSERDTLQGALYVKLGVDYSPETHFAWTALYHALAHYPKLQAQHPGTPFWYPSGLLQLAWNEREADRQRRFMARNQYPTDTVQCVSAAKASELSGLPVDCPALWFPENGHIAPDQLCEAALSHPGIETHRGSIATQIERAESGGWTVHTPARSFHANQLVVAAGAATAGLLPELALPLQAIRGQLSLMDAPKDSLPDCVVCGAGYAIPPQNGSQIVGATFDLNDNNPDPTRESHDQNLSNLAQWLPGLAARYDTTSAYQARVGFRATTPDYLPVAGPAHSPEQPDSVQSGLFILSGLGSKGLAYSPILAERIACAIAGEASALDEDLLQRLSIGRFQRKRNDKAGT